MKDRKKGVQKQDGFGLIRGGRQIAVFRSRDSAWPDFDSLILYAHRDVYILAEHCPDCGIVPLYRGHRCFDGGHEDCCPACGKVVDLYRSGEQPQRGDHCECSEQFCPFCPECSRLLDLELAEPMGMPQ